MIARTVLALYLAFVCAVGANAQTVAWVASSALPESLRCEASPFSGGRNSLVTPSGDTVVAGCQEIGSVRQLAVTRFSATGSVLWSIAHPDDGSTSTIPCCVAMDGNGNVIVGANSGSSVLIVKLSGTTGATIWQQHYDSGMGSTISSLELDAAGNVLIAGSGREFDTTSLIDFLTLKLHGDTGSLDWAKHYDGPGSDNDGAMAIAVSATGDVAVTGTAISAVSNLDITTIRYDGSNGNVQWVQRRDGGANRSDRGVAVAFDPSGDVIVTGTVAVAVAPTDILTLKYAGVSGSESWARLYQGAGNAADEARGLAIDAAGEVYVVGRSGFSDEDATVLRIAGTNGQLLWATRYDGGIAANESIYAIELDPLGRVFVAGNIRQGQAVDFLALGLSASDGGVEFVMAQDFGSGGTDRAYAIHQAHDLSLRVVGSVRTPAGDRLGVVRIEPDGIRLDGFEEQIPR